MRITHLPSGAIGRAEDERHQLQNKRLAFRRMAESPEFQRWARGPTQIVERSSEERVRTYNLVDRRVKDHRSGRQTTLVEAILDGDLDLVR